MNKEKELIDKLIDLAFAEDIGDGDHTTLSCIPATAMGKSKLLIKEAGVLAGIPGAAHPPRAAEPPRCRSSLLPGKRTRPPGACPAVQHQTSPASVIKA